MSQMLIDHDGPAAASHTRRAAPRLTQFSPGLIAWRSLQPKTVATQAVMFTDPHRSHNHRDNPTKALTGDHGGSALSDRPEPSNLGTNREVGPILRTADMRSR